MKKLGFSLMEMMVVLLIVAVIAAVSAPMINKKLLSEVELNAESPWLWTAGKTHAFYNSNLENRPAVIGSSNITDGHESSMLIINGDSTHPQLTLSDGNNHMRVWQNGGSFIATTSGMDNFNNQQHSVTIGEITLSNSSDVVMGHGARTVRIDDFNFNFQDAGKNVVNSQLKLEKILAGLITPPVFAINEALLEDNALAQNFENLFSPLSNYRDKNSLSGTARIAIGSGAYASADNTVAIGAHSTATSGDSVAIGNSAYAATDSVAIGVDATATHPVDGRDNAFAVAIGKGATAGQTAVAIGEQAKASVSVLGIVSQGSGAIAIGGDNNGKHTIAAGDQSIAIGIGARATGSHSVAIGAGVIANSNNRIVLGTNNDTVYIPGNLVVDRNVEFRRHESDNDHVAIRAHHSNVLRQIYAENDTWKGHFKATFADGVSSVLSDRRLKNVGKAFDGGLAEVRKLEVFNYTFKKDPNKTPMVGVMAQDLQKIFPNAVVKGDDGFLRIRMEDMFYALVNAVKELDKNISCISKEVKTAVADIASLKAKVDNQAKEISELRAQNNELVKKNADFEKRLIALEKKS